MVSHLDHLANNWSRNQKITIHVHHLQDKALAGMEHIYEDIRAYVTVQAKSSLVHTFCNYTELKFVGLVEETSLYHW